MNCSCKYADGTLCENEARYSYVWAWGESGVCCERHRFILVQQSQRLVRTVTIVPLEPGAPQPVTRDERIGYTSRILALEAELQELQARGLTLHEGTQELSRQLRTVTAQRATLEADRDEQGRQLAALSSSLSQAQQGAARAQAEVDRLTARLRLYELDAEPTPEPETPTVGGFAARPLDASGRPPHTP